MAAAKKPSKAGRPSGYKPEYTEQTYKLCLLGLTDEELATFFDVSVATIYNWKHAHPEFLEAIKKGKVIADANVSKSLYHRAIGYEHPDTHFATIAGEVVQVPTIKYYPPDTAAAFIWLKNRQRDKWRDKPEEGGSVEALAEALKEVFGRLPD